MPNHVYNVVTFDCCDKLNEEIIRFVKADDLRPGSIDFNKLIPMPDSIDTEHGVPSSNIIMRSMVYYLSDHGTKELDQEDAAVLDEYSKSNRTFFPPTVISVEEAKKAAEKGSDREDVFRQGEMYFRALKDTGYTNWYDWSCDHWGSKWNSYGYDYLPEKEGELIFNTAWSPVPDVIQELSRRFPDVDICYSWADEDFGYNLGRLSFLNGEVTGRYYPTEGSNEAYDFAAMIQGESIEDFGYTEDPKTGQYVPFYELEQAKED